MNLIFETFSITGPNSPGEMEAVPVEELPTADAVEVQQNFFR